MQDQFSALLATLPIVKSGQAMLHAPSLASTCAGEEIPVSSSSEGEEHFLDEPNVRYVPLGKATVPRGVSLLGDSVLFDLIFMGMPQIMIQLVVHAALSVEALPLPVMLRIKWWSPAMSSASARPSPANISISI